MLRDERYACCLAAALLQTDNTLALRKVAGVLPPPIEAHLDAIALVARPSRSRSEHFSPPSIAILKRACLQCVEAQGSASATSQGDYPEGSAAEHRGQPSRRARNYRARFAVLGGYARPRRYYCVARRQEQSVAASAPRRLTRKSPAALQSRVVLKP
jgi:hypothetical protein